MEKSNVQKNCFGFQIQLGVSVGTGKSNPVGNGK
jgi:hypothetical protein